MPVPAFDTFRAVNAAGMFFLTEAEVTAAALLFDRVFLPSNGEILREIARAYVKQNLPPFSVRRDRPPSRTKTPDAKVRMKLEVPPEFHDDFTAAEQAIAVPLLARAAFVAMHYRELFGPVFETEGEDAIPPHSVTKERAPDGKKMRFTFTQTLGFTDTDAFSERIEDGYFPLLTVPILPPSSTNTNATQLASILAMQAVKLALPRVKGASAEVILEARDRLRDHLPPFWSAMLKLSVELKKMLTQQSSIDLPHASQELVDTTIRPALLDLSSKLRRERRQWAYRILAPTRAALRLFLGQPLVTQQQLVTTALAVTSDVAASVADNLRTIESLKQDSGLMFLLKLSDEVGAG